MVADVYSSDNAVPDGLSNETVQFLVVADADADVLLRVAAQLRLGNVAPRAGAMTTVDDGIVVMIFVVSGLAASTVESIRRKLLQISTIREVEVVTMPAREQGREA